MSDDELTPWENRIGTGCAVIGRSCTAWLGAVEYEGRQRTGAIVGRAAGGVATGWFVGGITYAIGPWAWATAGALLAVSVWAAGRPGGTDEEEPADEKLSPAAFLELVHDVAQGGNVHLSAIREQLAEETETEWSGPATRALCDAAGIRVRDGVRVPGARPPVTTGIHRDDLPPLPQPLSQRAVDDVAAGHRDNTNTNGAGEQYVEGVTIVPDIMVKANR